MTLTGLKLVLVLGLLLLSIIEAHHVEVSCEMGEYFVMSPLVTYHASMRS